MASKTVRGKKTSKLTLSIKKDVPNDKERENQHTIHGSKDNFLSFSYLFSMYFTYNSNCEEKTKLEKHNKKKKKLKILKVPSIFQKYFMIQN